MSKLDARNKISTKFKVNAVHTKTFLCACSHIVTKLYELDTEEHGKNAVSVRSILMPT